MTHCAACHAFYVQGAGLPGMAPPGDEAPAEMPVVPHEVLLLVLTPIKTATGTGPQLVCKGWCDALPPCSATAQWLLHAAANGDLATAVAKAASCPDAARAQQLVVSLLIDKEHGLGQDATFAQFLAVATGGIHNAARAGHAGLCRLLLQRFDALPPWRPLRQQKLKLRL